MNTKILTLTLSGVLVLSCSSMTVTVESEPQKATVYLKDGKRLKKLGETPLQIEEKDFPDRQNINFSIQKEGYHPQDILIEKRTLSATAEVFANLQKLPQMNNLAGAPSVESTETQQRILASIQTELINNNHSQAEAMARSFLNQSPYSAVGWNLLGNAYLLQNRNQQALQAYQRALEYDPENKDTQKMIEFLRVSPQRRDR